MSYLQIAILALIQGAAELLPVSSSAHVIVAARLMGLDPSSPDMVFLLVMLHTGTMFAVLYYFWPRWRKGLALARANTTNRLHLPLMVVLATAVTGVIGLGLLFLIERVILEHLLGYPKGEVEALFRNLPLVATALFAVGLLIIFAGWHESRAETNDITPRSAIWIGLVQGLCLPFRGFSRSGATISTALLRGIARPLAEDFSFALAVVITPPVIVRSALRLLRTKEWSSSAELGNLVLPGLVGMGFSFVAGLLALRFLSAMLEQGRWKYFGYYCLVAAGVVGTVAVLLPPVSPDPEKESGGRLALPARGNADVRQAEQALDARPFAQVIPLDAVPNVLQEVAQDKGANAPVPLVPRQREQQHHASDGHRDAEQVNPEVERMAVALQPVAQGAAERAAAFGGVLVHACLAASGENRGRGKKR